MSCTHLQGSSVCTRLLCPMPRRSGASTGWCWLNSEMISSNSADEAIAPCRSSTASPGRERPARNTWMRASSILRRVRLITGRSPRGVSGRRRPGYRPAERIWGPASMSRAPRVLCTLDFLSLRSGRWRPIPRASQRRRTMLDAGVVFQPMAPTQWNSMGPNRLPRKLTRPPHGASAQKFRRRRCCL